MLAVFAPTGRVETFVGRARGERGAKKRGGESMAVGARGGGRTNGEAHRGEGVGGEIEFTSAFPMRSSEGPTQRRQAGRGCARGGKVIAAMDAPCRGEHELVCSHHSTSARRSRGRGRDKGQRQGRQGMKQQSRRLWPGRAPAQIVSRQLGAWRAAKINKADLSECRRRREKKKKSQEKKRVYLAAMRVLRSSCSRVAAGSRRKWKALQA